MSSFLLIPCTCLLDAAVYQYLSLPTGSDVIDDLERVFIRLEYLIIEFHNFTYLSGMWAWPDMQIRFRSAGLIWSHDCCRPIRSVCNRTPNVPLFTSLTNLTLTHLVTL